MARCLSRGRARRYAGPALGDPSARRSRAGGKAIGRLNRPPLLGEALLSAQFFYGLPAFLRHPISMNAIGAGPGPQAVMARLWREADLISVERAAPRTTPAGKILHLSAQPRPSQEPERAWA